jgi:hypothetical protein
MIGGSMSRDIPKKLDYGAYGVLKRIVGEDRAEPFHPLNRHPLILDGDEVDVGEVHGGSQDGAFGVRVNADTPVRNEGGSRFKSWVWVLFHYGQASEGL